MPPLRGSFLGDCTHICYEPREGFNLGSPGRQPGVRICVLYRTLEGFNFIFYSTPLGLEFSLAHNPELALGATHIQALRACVGIKFSSYIARI